MNPMFSHFVVWSVSVGLALLLTAAILYCLRKIEQLGDWMRAFDKAETRNENAEG